MTLIVGYPPNRQGRAVLNLAVMLARSAGRDLVVCTVVPTSWPAGITRGDAEYQAYRVDLAERKLQQAREDVPDDVPATFTVVKARSVASGLVQLAEEHSAALIVLGSSTAGMFGYITVSSVADRLLHSSPFPVALATRGFRCSSDERVTRVTVAYGGSQKNDALVGAALLVATRAGASMRLVPFAVQKRPPVTAYFGVEADDILETWSADMQASARRVLHHYAKDAAVPDPLEVVVGYGNDWDEAFENVGWDDGDVLVVGSSSIGPVARVFLGSRAAKIIRHSPVPVVVMPRAALKEIDEADQQDLDHTA
ncbi:MAG: universal stress protein [Micrococcales bacterium]|nr:universal stress protein [Micrococcales bacterium]